MNQKKIRSKKDNQKKSSVDNDCLSEGYFFLSPNNAPQIPPEFLEPWVQEVVISKYFIKEVNMV